MYYTQKDVLDFVREEDVKFIRLAFCDVYGRLKNESIMAGELKRAFEKGIPFDASAIDGFEGVEHSDMLLFPDPTTLTVLPWRPSQGRVVRLFSYLRYPDGRPYEADSRAILAAAVEKGKAHNIEFEIGSSFEFYLFKTDESGAATSEPYDEAGYFDVSPEDRGENIRREICLTLEEMGISPLSSHHEEGPGQNRINFSAADPLTAADHAVAFKNLVGTVAGRNGLHASFDPKPLSAESGSGMHITVSARDKSGQIDKKILKNRVIAGLLSKTRECTLFFNPTSNSYLRLGTNKAPKFVSWSGGNRSQLIRVPESDGGKLVELRSPDATANPYVAIALIIHASLDGIISEAELPESVDVNLYSAGAECSKNLEALPSTLREAAKLASSSPFIRDRLPEKIVEAYVKRANRNY